MALLHSWVYRPCFLRYLLLLLLSILLFGVLSSHLLVALEALVWLHHSHAALSPWILAASSSLQMVAAAVSISIGPVSPHPVLPITILALIVAPIERQFSS